MKVFFHRKFDKMFEKLPELVKRKFRERKHLFLQDLFHPLLNNHALTGPYETFRSINVTGDYRALYRHLSEKEILFTHIGTHHELFGT